MIFLFILNFNILEICFLYIPLLIAHYFKIALCILKDKSLYCYYCIIWVAKRKTFCIDNTDKWCIRLKVLKFYITSKCRILIKILTYRWTPFPLRKSYDLSQKWKRRQTHGKLQLDEVFFSEYSEYMLSATIWEFSKLYKII